MATSRGATPADPTLVATTDDAARGGLFARSNVANPVEGTDVAGSQINDTTITISIDGTSMDFTTNQATPETLTFTTTGGSGSNNYVTGGSFSATTMDLTLNLDGRPDVTIDLSDLVTQDELATAIAGFSPNETFTSLTDTPGSLSGQGGMFVAVNSAGTALEFVAGGMGNVSLSDFESSNTVTFSSSTLNPNAITAAATPTWSGNNLFGSVTGTVQATSIALDPSTGFILRDDGSGAYTITTPEAGPGFPNQGAPAGSSALDRAPALTFTITPNNGTLSSTSAVVRGPSGTIASGFTEAFTASSASVTIPQPAAGSTAPANPPGAYSVTFTTTTTTTGGQTRTDSPTVSSTRYFPFFISRTPITAGNFRSASESNAAWSNAAGFTAPAGTGRVYMAVLSNDLANTVTRALVGTAGSARVVRGADITLTLADSTTRVYHTFQVPAAAGEHVRNFS